MKFVRFISFCFIVLYIILSASLFFSSTSSFGPVQNDWVAQNQGIIVRMTQNPGIIVRITKLGLEYAAKKVTEETETKLETMALPSFHSEHLELTDLKIANLSKIGLSYSLQPPHNILLSGSLDYVDVRGNFRTNYKKSFIKIRKSGSLQAQAIDTRVTFEVALGSKHGHLTAEVAKCNAKVANLKLKVKAGFFGWLVNLFHSRAEKPLSKLLEKEICQKLAEVIAEQQIGQPNLTLAQGPYQMNYSLTAAPIVTADYIDVPFNGQVSLQEVDQLPFSPTPMLLPEDKIDRIMYVFVSEHVFNSALHQTFINNYLDFPIPSEDEHGSRDFLKISCTFDNPCLGLLFQNVAKHYPKDANFLVNIDVVGLAPLVLAETGIATQLVAEVEFRVQYSMIDAENMTAFSNESRTNCHISKSENIPTESNQTYFSTSGQEVSAETSDGFLPEQDKDSPKTCVTDVLDTWTISIGSTVSPKIAGYHISATSQITMLDISGPMSFMIPTLQNILKEKINKTLKKGLEIPSMQTYRLTNSVIEIDEGMLVMGTDRY